MTQLQHTQAKTPQTVASLLVNPDFKKQMAMVLPRHMNADRMARIAMTELRKNPKLAQCNISSFALSVLNAAQAGLEIGGIFGQAYLVPYGQECQLLVGYRGMIELAYRSGRIMGLDAEVVREGDVFEYERGSTPKLRHVPQGGDAPILYVYASANLMQGAYQFVVLSKQDIDRVQAKSKSQSIWREHYAEMGKKTAIRRLFKMLPVSAELARAMALDDAADRGDVIDLAGVLDGSEMNGQDLVKWDSQGASASDALLGQIEGKN